MEDALVLQDEATYKASGTSVLILVVMEDALVPIVQTDEDEEDES